PERREAKALVKTADARRAIAEEAESHSAVTAVLAREGHSRGQGDVAAYDPVTAKHMVLAIEHMHRSAEAPRASRDLAEKLRQERPRAHSFGQSDAVVPIRRDDVVLRTQSRD